MRLNDETTILIKNGTATRSLLRTLSNEATWTLLEAMISHPNSTIMELVVLTGFSRPSIDSKLKYLKDHGVVRYEGAVAGKARRNEYNLNVGTIVLELRE